MNHLYYLKEFFRQVFTRFVYEPTNSGILLYTLNAMKLFPNDGRNIALKVLEKVSSTFRLSYFQSSYDISTDESTIAMGKFAPFKGASKSSKKRSLKYTLHY